MSYRLSVMSYQLSDLEECFRIDPLPEFELEFPALVDQDLPVFGQHHPHTLERPGRGTLEIDAREAEAAAVARTLELRLGHQIVGRAAQMRAGGAQNIEAAG